MRTFGLPFTQTEQLVHLTDGVNPLEVVLIPNVNATNFYKEDGDWICYRRNYLQGACSFALHQGEELFQDNISIKTENGLQPVKAWNMVIACRTTDKRKDSELMQQNAKREKESVLPPEKTKSQPVKCWKMNPMEFEGAYRFERIQFKSSTSNNGRRRSPQHYHHVLFKLWAEIEGQEILVATIESEGLVVRGRSPSHYVNQGNESTSFEEDYYQDRMANHPYKLPHHPFPRMAPAVPYGHYRSYSDGIPPLAEPFYHQQSFAMYPPPSSKIPFDPVRASACENAGIPYVAYTPKCEKE